MTLDERIRKRREALGMTQAALAEKLGVTQPTISDWENGRGMRPATLGEIAAALDWTPNDLFGITEQGRSEP